MKKDRVCSSCLDSCEEAFYLVKFSNVESSSLMIVCPACNQALKQPIEDNNIFRKTWGLLQVRPCKKLVK